MAGKYAKCAKCDDLSLLLDLNKDDICIDCRLNAIDHQRRLENE